MIPLVAPEIFRVAVSERLIERAREVENEIWKNPWQWVNSVPDNVKEHIKKILCSGEMDQAWGAFVEKLRGEKRLLLYVQREYIKRWCGDYDPTIPESIENRNRPWDYDHIFPYVLVGGKHKVPNLIRHYLVNSIGNLRALPMELNRSESSALPREKLREDKNEEQTRKLYGVLDVDELKKASIVGDDDWEYWERLEADSAINVERRINLVKAISIRLTKIYEDWYTTLEIGDLMYKRSQEGVRDSGL